MNDTKATNYQKSKFVDMRIIFLGLCFAKELRQLRQNKYKQKQK